LTYSFNANTTYWPISPSTFELEVLAYSKIDGGYFYSANTICTPEHSGTHLDALIHFSAGQWTTDDIPLERLNGPGFVIDVTEQASIINSDYQLLTMEDVMNFESEYGEMITVAAVDVV
jgi:kynurenine formamidase